MDRSAGPYDPGGDGGGNTGCGQRAAARWYFTALASWLFATLAIWGPFLRMPMYIGCTLLLAVGMGRLVSDAIVARWMTPRRLRQVLGVLFGVLGILAAATTGRQAVLEHYTVANLSLPLAKAHNVVLIVWDTVRAQNSSLYGYPRDTTPNLTRWA